MVSTKVDSYVTITDSSKSQSYGKGTELLFDGTGKFITEKRLPIFQVIRAMDGDITDLSKKDLRKLSKKSNQALLESFGYSIEKDKKTYTLTSEEGDEITFQFEKFGEKISRKWTEQKEKWANARAERKAAREAKHAEKAAERAAAKEAKHAEKAALKRKEHLEYRAKLAERQQQRYKDTYNIDFDKENGLYNVSIKENVSIGKVATQLGLDELAVAKELQKDLKYYKDLKDQGNKDRETEHYSQIYDEISGAISNYEICDKNGNHYNGSLAYYTIPSGFDIAVSIDE